MPEQKILLCVTGLTPQVITETLYALAVKPDDPAQAWIPQQVHVITTAEGADRVRLTLLHPDSGQFHALLREYDLPPIHFDEKNIHILQNARGEPMQDIRSLQDNHIAADYITRKLRQFTANDDVALHVSLAGGRKTMGFYVGYALSLFGRAQDRLSHVLVNAPFESHPQFFYPTRASRVIYMQGAAAKPIDTKTARVTLADIPFVRMQQGVHERLDATDISFSEAVQAVQGGLSKMQLQLNPARRQLHIEERAVKLSANEYAFYWWLAQDCQRAGQGYHWSDDDCAAAFLHYLADVTGKDSGHYERSEKALRLGMTKEYFEAKKAKINRKLKQQLGTRSAQPCLIAPLSNKPGSRYKRFGLALSARQIEIL